MNEQIRAEFEEAIVESELVAETPYTVSRDSQGNYIHNMTSQFWIIWQSAHARYAGSGEACEDCPPEGYPTDKTRCLPCPRRSAQPKVPDEQPRSPLAEGQIWADGWNACRRVMLSAQENSK